MQHIGLVHLEGWPASFFARKLRLLTAVTVQKAKHQNTLCLLRFARKLHLAKSKKQ